ncbi:hypothetical protein [Sphingomonas sp. PAMC 26621]|uniref:hypothetical protein n=1 Tax=Sphingomonas sp. PAMC 26621 TaxID=1112213 RepID=UPI000289C692|nr:hypothetical protein [Sphingomonas sp. PAMC 26621]
MSQDQKPARVRVVSVGQTPPETGGTGGEDAATAIGEPGSGTPQSASRESVATLLLALIFVAAAGIGGALAAALLP